MEAVEGIVLPKGTWGVVWRVGWLEKRGGREPSLWLGEERKDRGGARLWIRGAHRVKEIKIRFSYIFFFLKLESIFKIP